MEKSVYSVYYILRASCKVNNRKTQELSNIVSRYDRTLVEFEEDGFTPHAMFRCLKNYTACLNQNYKGLEISVRMSKIDGEIHFAFSVPDKDHAIASIILCPVLNRIDCEDVL